MSGYAPLLTVVARALHSLQRAIVDPDALGRLIASAGWVAVPDAQTTARLQELLPMAALERCAELLSTLDNGGKLNAADIVELAAQIAAVASAIAGLADLTDDDVAGLPAELAMPALWSDLASAVPTQLLVGALDANVPLVASLLRLTGVVAREQSTTSNRSRLVAHWDKLPGAIADPIGALAEAQQWRTGFRAEPLLRELRALLARLGVRTSLHRSSQEVRDAITSEGAGDATALLESEIVLLRGIAPEGVAAEIGLLLASAETASGATGLYIGNLAYGELSAPVELAAGWTLTVQGELTGTATVGAVLRPEGLSVVGTTPSAEIAIHVAGRPDIPWRLIGGAEGTRLELSALDLRLGLTLEEAEPELWLEVALPDDALSLVLDFGAADGFLRSGVGSGLPSIEFSGGVRLGSLSGLTLMSGAGLSVTLPIDRQLGPVYVASLTIAVGSSDAGGTLSLTVAATVTIGPFAALVEGLGVSLALAQAADGGEFAGLDASLAFVPPTRIGLAIDLEGVVTGGGFVDHDPAIGRWSGALAIDALAIGLAAVVVVDTQLPDDPDGWAFFATISATFPSLPLGFGFFLSGVGGIVCLNRTMDIEALAVALKDGAADAILFPDDPLVDASLILSQLDAWFPLAAGSTVFGVAATIDWGTPVAIVTGELGILLSIPDLDFAVLGSITMALPEPETALIELHMDTLGAIDPAEGTVLVVASLYDSSLLSTVHLSGDMALYASFGASPYFLLSVGGYHPQFHPPTGLPSSVLNLRRMRAEVALGSAVWYALETYVALTSNSLQFGAEATLEATAKFLTTTYSARGSVSFDVLLVYSPFSFVADFEVSVAITAGSSDNELLAVGLTAHLEGPKPWCASGTARFEFLFVDVRFRVDFGSSARAEAPARIDVAELVLSALDNVRAWRGTVPIGGDANAVLLTGGEPADENVLWARPDGGIEVSQGVAPLNRELDRYGTYAIDGLTMLSLDGASVGHDGALPVEWEPMLDWFAPAQYDDLDRTAKLSAPSYEEMVAGVRFAATSLTSPGDLTRDVASITPAYEVAILEPTATRGLGEGPLCVPLSAATAGLALDASRRQRAGRTAGASVRYGVRPAHWLTADAITGLPLGAPGSHREAMLARRMIQRSDPSKHGSIRIAPVAAVQQGVSA